MMSETGEVPPIPEPRLPLTDAERLFIERWALMAASWGVPRSMAEVHALLFVTGEALTADDLMTELGISRGNASMTIRTLEEWGIVHREQRANERREYFRAEQDTLALFSTVIRIRKGREVDPLLSLVTECRARVEAGGARSAQFTRKLDDIQLFVTTVDTLASRHLEPGGDGMRSLLGSFSLLDTPGGER
jgi:DNA-binding transcriptional regulator GbsR (MarR family)